MLANLIAAAIIYLLGVLAGLFPKTAAAVNIAITVVVLACFVVLQGTTLLESKLDARESAYRK